MARPMPLAPPRDHRDLAGQLSARRCLGELVALERPVLDRERLGLRQRTEPAEGVGRVFDGDRPVVEIPRDASTAGVASAGHDPDARDEDDAGTRRVDRELARLVVDVAVVVVVIPLRVAADTCTKCVCQLGGRVGARIEVHDQRLVFRVDQVVGTGRSRSGSPRPSGLPRRTRLLRCFGRPRARARRRLQAERHAARAGTATEGRRPQRRRAPQRAGPQARSGHGRRRRSRGQRATRIRSSTRSSLRRSRPTSRARASRAARHGRSASLRAAERCAATCRSPDAGSRARRSRLRTPARRAFARPGSTSARSRRRDACGRRESPE